jgi:hypothetical protein
MLPSTLYPLSEKEVISDLPICVKEILTQGPGLVTRTYRVEISANNGIIMGSADIADDPEDMRLVVGRADAIRLLPTLKKYWKLGSIFEHVVKERVVLDMMMGGKDKGEANR